MEAKKRKELTPKQQKTRNILGWIGNAVCVCIVVFALVVAIFIIAGSTNDDRLTRFGDKIYMNVASDSMSPTFNTSDVLISNAYKEGDVLKPGMVITFKTTINVNGTMYEAFNTHRIMKVDGNNLYTRGDKKGGDWKAAIGTNDGTWDPGSVSVSKVVATWGSVDEAGNFTAGKMLKGVGGFSNWIQDTENAGQGMKTRFFCVIVLPLILLFVIYAFVLIRTLVIAKLEKEKVAKTVAVESGDLSEDEKRRIAEEYLASLKKDDSDNLADAGEQDNAEVTEEVKEEAPQEEAPAEASEETKED
ncbi:MAG: hypothetical protein MJ068_03800 [Clostridia bacterium]|nr:hypothetical protein [Clostridia bacterium]